MADVIPRLHRLTEERGRNPADIAVIPFGTIGSAAKLEHYAALGIKEVVLRVPSGNADEIRAELDSLMALLPVAATLA